MRDGPFQDAGERGACFFCEGRNRRLSSIEFNPSYETLDSVSGFGCSEITFRSAMDLLGFLGITSTADMEKLVSFPYDATGGRHLRVLGTMQDGSKDGDPTLSMFVGHSCVRDAAWLDVADTESAGHAGNIFFSDATWDSGNSFFSSKPAWRTSPTGYKDIASRECSSFKIRWETDPPKMQRTLGHVSVDTEGVRRGTMVVELPYYVLSPYFAAEFSALCNAGHLESIIANNMP